MNTLIHAHWPWSGYKNFSFWLNERGGCKILGLYAEELQRCWMKEDSCLNTNKIICSTYTCLVKLGLFPLNGCIVRKLVFSNLRSRVLFVKDKTPGYIYLFLLSKQIFLEICLVFFQVLWIYLLSRGSTDDSCPFYSPPPSNKAGRYSLMFFTQGSDSLIAIKIGVDKICNRGEEGIRIKIELSKFNILYGINENNKFLQILEFCAVIT